MKRFEELIPAVDKEILKSELTKDAFVKKTNNGGNEIYVVDAHTAPNIMDEIGRLREASFRDAGGGTGKPKDIDKYDISEKPFKQLIVWNPEDEEITGGYRFLQGNQMAIGEDGVPLTPTTGLFNISDKFVNEYLPYTIELGRSFVQPLYQPTYDLRKGFYSLDNLWDGLGGLIVLNPDMKYYFGKVTMYPRFNLTARDMILYFMEFYFPDNEELVRPKENLAILPVTDASEFDGMFEGGNYTVDFRKLVKAVRQYKEQVPPLVSAYMSLTNSMRTFGTARNNHFGGVEETGILVTIADIYDEKKERHMKINE